MSFSAKHIRDTKAKTDKISPTFCMAKWHHVSMYLHQGNNHSCYHSKVHSMELDGNPMHLHNTMYKKEQRKKMLEGKRPYECHYCFNVEDCGSHLISDRMTQNSEQWALENIDETKNLDWDADVYPHYLEVSFSQLCNLKCAYCNPGASSKWLSEIKQHGDYPISNSQYQIQYLKDLKSEEENPYVKAFWEWFPEAYPHLYTLRVTGGEPLLSDGFYKLLDWVKENPSQRLNQLNCNSNLTIKDNVFEKFTKEIGEALEKKHIKEFLLFASIDTWGPQAEYARFGLDLEQFERNVHKYLTDVPTGLISFMITFNLFSIPNFKELLKIILKLKKQYNTADYKQRIHLDVPYMSEPAHLTALILPESFHDLVKDSVDFMIENKVESDQDKAGFTELEINNVKRTYEWLTTHNKYEKLERDRADFYRFINEHDRRRNVEFLNCFPEYSEFYNICKTAAEARSADTKKDEQGSMSWMEHKEDQFN